MNVEWSFRGKSLFTSITDIVSMVHRKKEHQNRNANMSYYVSTINKELTDNLCNMGSVYVKQKKRKKFACANGTFRISYACAVTHIWIVLTAFNLHWQHFCWIKRCWCGISNRLICQFYCWMHVVIRFFFRLFTLLGWFVGIFFSFSIRYLNEVNSIRRCDKNFDVCSNQSNPSYDLFHDELNGMLFICVTSGFWTQSTVLLQQVARHIAKECIRRKKIW